MGGVAIGGAVTCESREIKLGRRARPNDILVKLYIRTACTPPGIPGEGTEFPGGVLELPGVQYPLEKS